MGGESGTKAEELISNSIFLAPPFAQFPITITILLRRTCLFNDYPAQLRYWLTCRCFSSVYQPFSRRRSPLILPFSSTTVNLRAPVTMAATVKAINAKIRSNKVLDYFCSTRTFSMSPRSVPGRLSRELFF